MTESERFGGYPEKAKTMSEETRVPRVDELIIPAVEERAWIEGPLEHLERRIDELEERVASLETQPDVVR